MARRTPILTLERRNPLPVGYYWQDVFEDQSQAFGEWLRKNRGAVVVRETEGENPAWVKFEVREPVPWEGPGLPTVAGRDTHRRDTVPGARNQGGMGREIKRLAWFGAFGVASYFGLDLVLKHRREIRKVEAPKEAEG